MNNLTETEAASAPIIADGCDLSDITSNTVFDSLLKDKENQKIASLYENVSKESLDCDIIVSEYMGSKASHAAPSLSFENILADIKDSFANLK
jgi:hypothetical protein